MASNAPIIPPYVRLATVYGVVVLRRTTSGLWAGRGLRKMECAKRGFLSDEKEIIQWKEVKNMCVVCCKPSTLVVQWEGPGTEKPLGAYGAREAFKGMCYKPVKVMDAYVCGICRITCLPRIIILTQWNLQGLKLDPADCTCQWDGKLLSHCNHCALIARCGRLLHVKSARGWQVRRFLDPLRAFSSEDHGWAPRPTAAAIPLGMGGDGRSRSTGAGPSAPPLHLEGAAAESATYSADLGARGRRTLLDEAIHHGWPYDPSFGRVAYPPLATDQLPLVLRVFRDPATPGYTSGMDELSDDVRELAQATGWEGPWELTTWGRLIGEVVSRTDVPLEDLPNVPREEGARGTNLYYYTTGIDAWGHSGAKSKMKRAEYYVTPESWVRNAVTQIPGSVASRIDTPLRPDQTVKVMITVQMVVVPYGGVYSVGADVEVVDESPALASPEPAAEEEKPKQQFRDWIRKRWEARKGSQKQ